MKRNFTIVALIAASLILIFQSEVYTNSANPPNDHSGAPPSNITCAKSGCHNSFVTQNGDGKILITADSGTGPVVLDDNFKYRLGKKYDINISLTGNKPRYGFQMTILDNTLASKGGWVVSTGSSTKATIQSTGVKTFFEHLNAGTTKSWTLEWTAPSTDPGPLGIYAVANFANGNGNSSGDSIFKVSHTINAIVDTMDTMPTGIYQADVYDLQLYPNPISDGILHLLYTNLSNNISDIQIYDASGRMVQYVPGDIANGGQIHKTISLHHGLNPGIYFVEIRTSDGSMASRKKLLLI